MKRLGLWPALAVILAGMCLLPWVISSYYLGLATLILATAIFAMSLDLIQGYLGLASLGHGAFWGTSAYAVGLMNTRLDGAAGLVGEFAVGIFAAAIVAAVLGLIALRSKGVYFLMITLASAMMLWGVAVKWRAVTGGDDGIVGIGRPSFGFAGMDLGDHTQFYFFVLAFTVIAGLLMYAIVKSTFGKVLEGVRESEVRMKALGYNVWLHKYIAFVVAGVFAGLGGILATYYNGYVGPSELHLVTSAEALIMVILGGAGTLFGPAVGALVVVLIKSIGSGYTQHWMLILGALYIGTVVLAPDGVFNLFLRWWRGE